MSQPITVQDIRQKVAEAGPSPWFRPMRILQDEFRYYGVMRHNTLGTLGAMLDLHARGFLVDDGHDYGIDLIGENGHDLYDTLPLSRDGMRFLRACWGLRIDRPRRYVRGASTVLHE